jgi:hypothetical protein
VIILFNLIFIQQASSKQKAKTFIQCDGLWLKGTNQELRPKKFRKEKHKQKRFGKSEVVWFFCWQHLIINHVWHLVKAATKKYNNKSNKNEKTF